MKIIRAKTEKANEIWDKVKRASNGAPKLLAEKIKWRIEIIMKERNG